MTGIQPAIPDIVSGGLYVEKIAFLTNRGL